MATASVPLDDADAPARMVIASAPVLLWMSGTEPGRTYTSCQWVEFTGRPHEDQLELRWAAIVHPDDLDHCLSAHLEARERSEPFEREYRLRRADGSWRWLLDRAVPRFDSGGAFSGYVGACVDITELRQTGEELRRSRDDLRLALGAGTIGTWMWDRASGRVSRDSNLQRIYGLPAESDGGSYGEWTALLHPDESAWVLREVQRALAEGGSYHLEHRIRRPDGGVVWVERRGEAYRDERGEVAGTRGLVVDVTERKAAEEERNRLLEAEREARRRAEAAARRLANLQAITAELAEPRTAEEVADVIVSKGSQGLDASSSALCILQDDGETLEVIRQAGYSPGTVERYQTFSIDADLPASEALRTGEIVLLRSLEERDARFPLLRGVPALNSSFAIVPLVESGRPTGSIAFGWAGPRDFDEDDRRFLLAIGQQASQALDRARFYEAEHWRAQRQSFLAEASRVLTSSLDFEDTLARVARLAVPMVADACSVYIVEDEELRPVAEVSSGEAGKEQLRTLTTDRDGLVNTRLREAVTADQPRLVGGAGVASAMLVPIRVRDQALGVLVVAMAESARTYGQRDLPVVEDLATRAASAIANARSHRARTEVSRTLQRSLLPPKAPVIPGLEVAARYRPVGEEIEVGGDFYDVFPAGPRRWGLVIGDVSGKGIAAASLTALARYTVRAAAMQERQPSAVLEFLNRSILDHPAGEQYCTMAMAFVELMPDGVHLSLSCGGHPQPFLVDVRGEVRQLGTCGTAMGLLSKPVLVDDSYLLQPGEALVLYTDGALEARSPQGAFADGLLEETVSRCAGASADEIAGATEQALLQFQEGRQRDDIAILVLRRAPEVFHRPVCPTGPTGPDCDDLRTWLAGHMAASDVGDLTSVVETAITEALQATPRSVQVLGWVDAENVTIDIYAEGADDDNGMSATNRRVAQTGTGGVTVQADSTGSTVRIVRRRQPAEADPR